MQGYIKRNIESRIIEDTCDYPAVAILGPRQCGKTTTAINIKSMMDNFVYIDLERLSDIRKLYDPEIFFKSNKGALICLDEIQNKPGLFPVLRSILDENKINGQVLILGSASSDLIRQSSETLAGRISYIELTPFMLSEVNDGKFETFKSLWLRGGFPRSFLSETDKKSLRWRMNFIRTFLERDIGSLGFNISPNVLRRLWMMCAHLHGQVLNSSMIGESLGVSYHTVRNYIDLLEQTFMLRVLHPLKSNIRKRLVKSPKVYIRDTGILHALLEIETYNQLLGHPVYGPSWEGLVIENILSELPEWNSSFYRTSAGAEIDLVLEKGGKRIAVECKASSSPSVSRGFWNSLDDLEVDHSWIIAPVEEQYNIKEKVTVSQLELFISEMKEIKS